MLATFAKKYKWGVHITTHKYDDEFIAYKSLCNSNEKCLHVPSPGRCLRASSVAGDFSDSSPPVERWVPGSS